MSELDEQMIELTIEALTGTVYDLCVSPFETVLGIKMKIQRLEGSCLVSMSSPSLWRCSLWQRLSCRYPCVPAAAGSRQY